MVQHTLVLSTAKITLPDSVSIDFVSGLINRGLTQVEYFGCEIDNHCDIVSEDMEAVTKEITYIDMHFDSDAPINYEEFDQTDVFNFATDLLEDCSPEIRKDEKDITIYL